MNQNDFIPYEQALALKELGFDEEVSSHYFIGNPKGSYGSKENPWFSDYSLNDEEQVEIIDYNQYPGTVSAPSHSQAFKWFREKHHIHCVVKATHFVNDWCKTLYGFEILTGEGFVGPDDFESYEEAELECLKKLIEIVKQ